MRLKGHALAHLAQRPPWGWAWQCECGFRTPFYAGTKGIAQNEHREHKERVGTASEHASITSYPTRAGDVLSMCSCGAALGSTLTRDDAERAHRAHVIQHTEPTEHEHDV